ncbi:MAG TPA: baseplate J/gp47 family protein [Xanthobacteraceae bacterium]|nr:baseplate J/gp47 family protein [Xanthobacteraceae bacterium]
MPWNTQTLTQVRQQNRDYVTAQIGAPLPPNSNSRVLADGNAGLAYLNLRYLDWLAKQLLPDTAESEFLDRWATIFLTNADGSKGRKAATYASGSVTFTGLATTPVPVGSQLVGYGSPAIGYETTEAIVISGATACTIRATIAGAAGNLDAGETLTLAIAIPGVDAGATVVTLTGGTDAETDPQLLARLLQRIQEPPMGGDQADYVTWTESVAGVTRAWCYPQEMGIGTVTVRFMCDELEAAFNGFPQAADIAAVTAYLNTVRPVTVQDLFVVAPVANPMNFTVANLAVAANTTLTAVKAAIATSVSAMLFEVAIPGQTIFSEWVSAAIRYTQGVASFDLTMSDFVQPDNGHMATLGVITWA